MVKLCWLCVRQLQCDDREKQLCGLQVPSVFDFGRVCHLANLCAIAGVKALPLPVEDILVEVISIFITGRDFVTICRWILIFIIIIKKCAFD
jgi:hypothetical protein